MLRINHITLKTLLQTFDALVTENCGSPLQSYLYAHVLFCWLLSIIDYISNAELLWIMKRKRRLSWFYSDIRTLCGFYYCSSKFSSQAFRRQCDVTELPL